MSKRNPTTTIDTIGVVICLALTTGLYFLGVAPLLDNYHQFVAQQEELHQKKESAATASSSLGAARHKLEQLQADFVAAPLQLQSAGRINQRLAQITDLASKNSLKIEDVQPGKSSRGVHFEVVPVRIAGSGTYKTAMLFIHDLRTRFPDTGISSFTLTGNPRDPSQPAKFQFDLDWYASLSPVASIK